MYGNARDVPVAGTGERGGARIGAGALGEQTALASPWDLVLYPSDHEITIAMAGTHQLWVYDLNSKRLRILAGNGSEGIDDGAYPVNSMAQPSGLSVHNGSLYLVDAETSSLRVLRNGALTTLIGSGLFDFGYQDGRRGVARMQHPLGVYANSSGVYIADAYNHAIRFYNKTTGLLSNYSGVGRQGETVSDLRTTEYNEPNDIVRGSDGHFYVADTNNHRILVLDPDDNIVTQLSIAMCREVPKKLPVDELPQLVESSPATVQADTGIRVTLAMAEGWKINPDATSTLTLFKIVENGEPTVVAEFDNSMLRTRTITLPAMPDVTKLRLQGTIFYCESKANALCLLQSHDQMLTVAKDGGVDSLTISLKQV